MPTYRSAAGLAALSVLLISATGAAQAEPLLTKEDVEEVLGIALVVDTRGADGFSFTASKPVGSVTIDPLDAAVFAMMPKRPEAAIEGVGDEAFFQLDMANTIVLQAVKGSSGFVLSVMFPMGIPPAITDLKATAVELAKIAAGKL